MARINIEDSLFDDVRYIKLKNKVGEARALSQCIMLWRTAQQFWKQNKKLIPEEVFNDRKLSKELIEVGLAERRVNDGIYAKGSEAHFSWLLSRVLSASRPRKTKLNNISDIDLTKQERNVSETLAKQEPPSSFLFPLSSFLFPLSSKNKEGEEKQKEEVYCQLDQNLFNQKQTIVSANADHSDQNCPLVEIWNLNKGLLPECKSLGATRGRRAKARWKEKPNREYWENVVKKIAGSKFCTGSNDRGWVANFDFFIKPETHLKASEGTYDNRESSVIKQKSELVSDYNKAMHNKILRGEV